MSLARKNSILSKTINADYSANGDTLFIPNSGIVNISGTLTATSGNFTTVVVNGTSVSDFNSSVSGLLPTIANSGDNRILTSTGSTVGINAESNLTFDGSLLNVVGSGSFSSNLNLSSQTVNTIAGFDGSKNIVSLPTSTYPSFTELSYVKGVTSSIQTQLNGKAPTASPAFTGNATITASSGIPLTLNGNSTALRIEEGSGETIDIYRQVSDGLLYLDANQQTFSGFVFRTTPTGGSVTERLRIKSTGESEFTGSVVVNNTGNVVPLTVTNTGTANSFVVNDESGDTTPFVIDASGRVAIGSTSAFNNAHFFSILSMVSDGGNSVPFIVRATIPSSTTGICIGVFTNLTTEAASFTLLYLEHFTANMQGELGAGSSIANQYGFVARSTLTGATNNYGFYSDIASGTGRWNFYSNGTAPSFFGGQLLVTAGSASACGVAFSGDPDTGIAQLGGANTLSFVTNEAERLQINADGNAIFTRPGEYALVMRRTDTGVTNNFISAIAYDAKNASGTYHSYCRLITQQTDATAGTESGQFYLQVRNNGTERSYVLIDGESDTVRLLTGGSERMRVDADGRVQINRTSPLNQEMLTVLQASVKPGVVIKSTATSGTAEPSLYLEKQDNNNTTAQKYVLFAYNAGVNGAGGIEGNGGTGAQFFASSDERLKENIADLAPQLANIMAMKPRVFDYISGPTGCTGFVAQELEEIYPDAVGVDAHGYKTIGGISIMETRIISAIQELAARIAALEEKPNHA